MTLTKSADATFKWGTESGLELVELEPRMSLFSERSLSEEMRKHTMRGMLFANSPSGNLINRIAVFCW